MLQACPAGCRCVVWFFVVLEFLVLFLRFWALNVVCVGGLGFGVLYVRVLGFGFWVLGLWGLGFDVLGFRRFKVSCET